MRLLRLGDMAVTACDMGPVTRLYPQAIAAADSFEVPNEWLVLVLEVGNTETGTYFGEARVLVQDGRIGWVPMVHLALVV